MGLFYSIPIVGSVVKAIVAVLTSGACWVVSQPPEIVKAACEALGNPCK